MVPPLISNPLSILTMINLVSPGPRLVQGQGDLSCPEEGKQYGGYELSGYPVTTDTVEACAAL